MLDSDDTEAAGPRNPEVARQIFEAEVAVGAICNMLARQIGGEAAAVTALALYLSARSRGEKT